MDKKVKFGIIGVGNMGSGHLASFEDGLVTNGVVTALSDFKSIKLDAAIEKYGDKYKCYNSGRELIHSGDVDAVIIATPHYSHPELSILALKKGLNVICEKPAGVYANQVKEMNKVALDSKALFAIMFNQRTNPLYITMRNKILNGEIGEIKRVSWIITDWYRSQSYYDSGSWRATWAGEGGGVLINQCPHQLDLLQWVTGMMPQKVQAFCHFGKWHNIEVEDDVTAYLEYGNGATGTFVTSTADCPGNNRFEVLGTKGRLIAEDGKLKEDILTVDERIFNRDNKGGFESPKIERSAYVEIVGDNPQHVGVLNNFADAVLNKAKLFMDGTEGLNGVELMNAMMLSTWIGAKVELPVDGELYLKQLNDRVALSKTKNVEDRVLETKGTYGGSK